jgi:hypothetical protein
MYKIKSEKNHEIAALCKTRVFRIAGRKESNLSNKYVRVKRNSEIKVLPYEAHVGGPIITPVLGAKSLVLKKEKREHLL